MSSPLQASVIISTYNQPDWLEKCLWGFGYQTRRDFEVVIADDGSDTAIYTVDDLALRASAGMSIFWDSPFGPVRFDLAHAFIKEDYDQGAFFRFSTRTGF